MMREILPPTCTDFVDHFARRGAWFLGATAILMLPALGLAQTPGPPAPPPSAAPPEDGQWPMAAKNYAATRYSGLDEISGTNVKNLTVALTFSTAVLKGEEAAPLVVNN